MHMDLRLRFDYGSIVPWVRRTAGGLHAVAGPDAVEVWSEVELRGEGFTTFADFEVREHHTFAFSMSWHPSTEPRRPPLDHRWAVAHTEDWWKRWAARCTYRGEWRDAVMRSLLTLKALTYAPTGGIVAAPTTSLPEIVGGERNWDYRYCWLRDATFTLYSFLTAGYMEEARAWRDWLIRAVAGRPEELQIMYGVAGERRLTEFELEWLDGYEGSSAGADRERGDRAVSARRLRRGPRPAPRRRRRRDGPRGRGVARRARDARVPRGRVEGARRGHLGGARAASRLHALEGDGVGGVRPGDPYGGGAPTSRGRSTDGSSDAPRSTTRSVARGSTPSAGRSSSTTGPTGSTPRC